MSHLPHLTLSPLTLKRLRQFRHNRRACWALLALLALYAFSLAAPLICRYRPNAVMDPAAFEARGSANRYTYSTACAPSEDFV